MREFARGFYLSKEWRRTRAYIVARDHGLCVKCGRPGEIVHHKEHLTPENINTPEIALGENNLEFKPAETKTVEEKPVAAEVEEPAKKPAAKKTVRKTTTAKKTTKTAAKTTTRKTTAKKTETVTEVYVQYWGKEIHTSEVADRIRKIWTDDMGKKASDLKDLKIYIKPEDNGAHYVINGDVTGFIGL